MYHDCKEMRKGGGDSKTESSSSKFLESLQVIFIRTYHELPENSIAKFSKISRNLSKFFFLIYGKFIGNLREFP